MVYNVGDQLMMIMITTLVLHNRQPIEDIVYSIQWKLGITRSLEMGFFFFFFFCYIRYFVISVVNKQYKTKQFNSLVHGKIVCNIRYFATSDQFISSFQYTIGGFEWIFMILLRVQHSHSRHQKTTSNNRRITIKADWDSARNDH